MKNMGLSTKLMVSFLIVIVLAAVVGAVGIFGMYEINAADDALYNGNYLPTIMAGNISENINRQRMNLRSIILYDSSEEAAVFNEASAALDKLLEEQKTLLSDYDKSIDHDDDRAAYNELVKLYEGNWLPFIAQARALGAENRMDEAKALIQESGNLATAASLDELTSKLQEINMKDGETSVGNNTKLFTTMLFIQLGVLVVAIAIAVFLVLYLSNIIGKPITVMAAALEQMGTKGDLVLTPDMQKTAEACAPRKDEIGTCSRATAGLIEHLMDVEKELSRIAEGDLTVTVNTLSERDTIGLSVAGLVENLNRMFGEINASTAQVSTGSKQIADGAQSLAQGSTEQAASVEELSSSIAEIAKKTEGNAEMAGKAANLAGIIMQNAEKGSSQMNDMMTAVKEINEASQNINKVIKAIDDIAFQTNILALNAAVEAARAGQHGKGFAVVAEEVRNLAAKSAEAAKDTGKLIVNSIEKAELGSRIAGETAASLGDIVSGITESSQIVGDIAKSSHEQSVGISQINIGIDQIAQVVQQNSATAQQSAAASEEMSGQAHLLENLVAQFRLKGGPVGHAGGGHGAEWGGKNMLPNPMAARSGYGEPMPSYGENELW